MIERLLNISKTNTFFLFGARQTGKSSLIERTFPRTEALFFDLLLTEEYRRLKQHPDNFRRAVQTRDAKIKYVVIDEIQRVPELLNEVHFLSRLPNAPVFAMTGSSARRLRKPDVNLLGGRAWRYELFPFTGEELGARFDLQRALELGTLPPIYLAADSPAAAQSLKAYVDTYLKEEIEAEAATRNLAAFFKFLPLAAESSGKPVNFSKIARVCITAPNTIKGYFKILEDTLIGRFLYPYAGSTRQQLSKHPKFYLFDTGVQRAILGRERSPLHSGTYEYGDLFESWVINEIWRLNSYFRKNAATSYFRLETGAEIDLVLETPNKETIAIEIKSDPSVTADEVAASFAAFEREHRLHRKICVAPLTRSFTERGIEFLSVTQLAELIRGLA